MLIFPTLIHKIFPLQIFHGDTLWISIFQTIQK